MVDHRQPTINKPSRSDEVLDPDQQLRIADQVRAQFDSMAPKRPVKPNRSEPDPDASLAQQTQPGPIPELERLHSLKSQSQVVVSTDGEGAVQEEFVETEYYKELVSIDKQHHTTGTGFIKVTQEEIENGQRDNHELQILSENGGERFRGFKSNPATNDWVPSVEAYNQVFLLCLTFSFFYFFSSKKNPNN